MKLWCCLAVVAVLLAGVISPAVASGGSLTLTRAGVAYFMACALTGGEETVPAGPATPTYPDVPTTHWAYKYIEYCTAHGLMQGYGDGSFHPSWPVNRDQLAVFVARMKAGGDANVPVGPATATFLDIPPDYWAYKYVEYLYAQGLDIDATPDPLTFAPTEVATLADGHYWYEQAVGATALDPARVLIVEFTGTPTSGAAALEVTFADVSNGSPTSWSWDFGDGGTSTEQNPAHTYAAAGTYAVTLTISRSDGFERGTKTDYITVTGAVTDFTASVTEGGAPLTVDFTDTSTGGPTAWSWSFGDGGTSTEQNPQHLYEAAGLYTVVLTVTRTDGDDTNAKINYIHVYDVPVASFTPSLTYGPPPLLVSFTDTSTAEPASWLWDFGDGTTSTEQNPSHEYGEIGLYSVLLTVTNPGGSTSAAGYVLVGEPSTADFSATPTVVGVGETVQFTDFSTGTPFAWWWNFGDGSDLGLEQNPTHQYAAPGLYSVTLRVQGAGPDSTLTKSDYLLVVAAPVPDFSADPTEATTGTPVSFTDLSTGGPDAWLWSFGDGLGATAQSPTHAYGAPGFYTVSLNASTLGVEATATKEHYVAVGFPNAGPSYNFFRPVIACVEAGVVTGFGDGSYRPAQEVKREAMAVYIARAMCGGEDAVPIFIGTPTFADVDPSSWALNHIEFCAGAGVVTGFSGGTYAPGWLVTRGQMAAYIARAISPEAQRPDLPDYLPPATSDFPDVATDYGYYKYIEYLYQEGLITGFGDGTYGPTRTVTRGQMAIYVQRAFGYETYAP